MTVDTQLLKAEAAAFGAELDARALERFDLLARRLIETNKVMNLTAVTDPTEVLYKHFADSLTLLPAIRAEGSRRVIDVGTGAGFPGLALLIAEPSLEMTLLDSTRKKLDYIDAVLGELGLSAETLHSRAEEAGALPDYRESFDFACARAVAALRELCEYCLPFVRRGGLFAAMKGQNISEEILGARSAIRLLGGRIDRTDSFTLPLCGARSLIYVRKISQTPPKYPRPSAKIAKQPLV